MPTDPYERLAGRARDFARGLAKSFGNSLLAAAAAFGGSSIGFLNRAEGLLDRHLQQLQAATFDVVAAGYLSGADAMLRRVPVGGGSGMFPADPRSIFYPPGEEPRIVFPITESAIARLEGSLAITPNLYYSMAADARRRAFTITADIQRGTMDEVRELLAEHIGSRTAFEEAVRVKLPTLPLSDARLEMVYRNNVNGVFSDGGEAALADPIVSDAFPFRAYYAIHDDRARPEHRLLEKLGLSGTNVYHYLDPVWSVFRPPWDWGCRCGWNPLTIRQASRKGVAVAKQWLDTGVEPVDMFVTFPPFLPSPSWNRLAA